MSKELHKSINALLKSLNQQIDKFTEKHDKLVVQVKEPKSKPAIINQQHNSVMSCIL